MTGFVKTDFYLDIALHPFPKIRLELVVGSIRPMPDLHWSAARLTGNHAWFADTPAAHALLATLAVAFAPHVYVAVAAMMLAGMALIATANTLGGGHIDSEEKREAV